MIRPWSFLQLHLRKVSMGTLVSFALEMFMLTSHRAILCSTISLDATTVPPEPREILCVDFQYELINNQSLSADDIMNEVDNTLKSGLIEATRTTVINILNETYPRSNGGSFQPPPNEASKTVATIPEEDDGDFVGQVMFPEGRYRKLLQAVEKADAFVMDVDLATYRQEMEDSMASLLNIVTRSRRLHTNMRDSRAFLRRARRLVYYSDEFPVQITRIVDSAICPGSIMNDFISCAVVSSTVCVVLEPGDDPAEIRRTIVNGLEEAFMNGDFINNIPTGSRRRRMMMYL